MIALAASAATLFVIAAAAVYVAVLFYQHGTLVERERDHIQDVLEGSGVVWSDTEEEALESALDKVYAQEIEEEEEETRPGHFGRWDESQSTQYD